MALPYRTTGSLCPTFVSARLVSLAVKHAYAIALLARCPTVPSVPSNSSVTLWEETAPVKLPTMHCPHSAYMEFLPVLYREVDFIGRFMKIFEQAYQPVIDSFNVS